MKLVILLGVFFSLTAFAGTEHFSFAPESVVIKSMRSANGDFSSINIDGLENSKIVGAPDVPMKSFLLIGHPEDIRPELVIHSQTLSNVKPLPVQEQPCRCDTDRSLKFEYDAAAYENQKSYELTYIGSLRGVPVTRLDVPVAKYNSASNSVDVAVDMKISYNTEVFTTSTRETFTDYLIIAPERLAAGAADFVVWKKSQGYNVTVEKVLTPQLTLDGISKIVTDAYKNKGADFVIILGDENTVPMHKVSTSGGTTTTDMNYYTMDGATDTIPDMFYSRIAVTTPEAVKSTLAKAIEFDKQSYKNKAGLKKIIGIASDEGSNPSDDEYVKSIEDQFGTLGFTTDHYYQEDKKSNAENLNKSLSAGASWLVYLGHGSGSSWPSMNKTYNVKDIFNVKNRDSVKPIIIDVACQNGRLLPDYIGTAFSNVVKGEAYGAAAYYGGTVNISWHPPAIMARGIAIEHAAKNFRHLGEALLAGQMYLAANMNVKKQVEDNFKWYQLQGDPGMLIAY